jgi:hypothetical protein
MFTGKTEAHVNEVDMLIKGFKDGGLDTAQTKKLSNLMWKPERES